MAKDSDNKSSGSEHTKAGDGRLFRNNIRDTGASNKHVADRSPQNTTSDKPDGRHRAE